MPAPSRRQPVYINGNPYLLARSTGQRQSFRVEEVSAAGPDDTLPFEETVSFGYLGMGSSLPAIREQYDYSVGADVETWDEIGPGLLQHKVGLALDAPIVAMEVVRDANGNRYLYAGGGVQLAKIRLTAIGVNAAFGVVTTKTFAGGSISDIARLRDATARAFPSGPFFAYSVDAYLLIALGQGAAIQQIDTIGVDTTDTYKMGAATAYAGLFAVGTGTDTVSTGAAYRSSGLVSETAGPFGAVKMATVIQTAKDYTATGSWGANVLVSDGSNPITGLAMFERAPLAATATGLYEYDATYGAWSPFGTRYYQHDENGAGLLAWGREVIFPTVQDVKAWPGDPNDPTVGLSTLLSNLSPFTGRPTATAAYGRYLYVSYYDGTNSWLVRSRRRVSESVPHPMLHYPQFELASHKCRKMLVSDNGDTAAEPKEILFYHTPSATSGKHDVGYCFLDPPSAREYAASAAWLSTRMGSMGKRTVIEEISGMCVDAGADAYWQLSVAWQDGGFTAVGSAITAADDGTATGRYTRTPVAGTADSGYQYQILATLTNSTSSHRPRLRGASSEQTGGGGFTVRGQRQADTVEYFTMVFEAGNHADRGDGGVIKQNAREQYAALKALEGTTTTMIDEDHFGDRSAHPITLVRVSYTRGDEDAPDPRGRAITVRAKRALNAS